MTAHEAFMNWAFPYLVAVGLIVLGAVIGIVATIAIVSVRRKHSD